MANPARIGMPTRKTIVVPCMVNSTLNVWAETKWLSATASWIRISVASIPPITRNPRANTIYMMPSRL